MLLIDCDLTFNLIWSANRVISEADRVTTFAITDAKLMFQFQVKITQS